MKKLIAALFLLLQMLVPHFCGAVMPPYSMMTEPTPSPKESEAQRLEKTVEDLENLEKRLNETIDRLEKKAPSPTPIPHDKRSRP